MKSKTEYFHCGDQLKKTLSKEIGEVEASVAAIEWSADFVFSGNGKSQSHQAGYNKAFAAEFSRRDWELQPTLRQAPKLIGDFQKGLVFAPIHKRPFRLHAYI